MALSNSINTNVGAMVALRSLNTVSSDLAKAQDRISTGLKVIGAKDNASSFAIAQGIRAEIKASAPGSLDTSLSHAAGLIEIVACHA